MTRYLFTLRTPKDRRKVMQAVVSAPEGTRVELKGTKRTLDQNARMWAILTDVATQREHHGRRYTPDQWKRIFMHACGMEVQSFIPSLDGATFIPWGGRSSDLSKEEMSNLIDFIQSWAAENGIVLHDTPSLASAKAA